MIENAMCVTTLVEQFIKETGYKLNTTNREINVNDLCIFDKETNKLINYGDVNDIINSNEFKEWYESKGDNNG